MIALGASAPAAHALSSSAWAQAAATDFGDGSSACEDAITETASVAWCQPAPPARPIASTPSRNQPARWLSAVMIEPAEPSPFNAPRYDFLPTAVAMPLVSIAGDADGNLTSIGAGFGQASTITPVDDDAEQPRQVFPLRRSLLVSIISPPLGRIRGGLLTNKELHDLIEGAPSLPGEAPKGMSMAELLANALKNPNHVGWSRR
jgi:hypothetical protein